MARKSVDLCPTERIAIVTFSLAKGEALASRQVADRTGCTPEGARRLLAKVSRVLPLTEDATKAPNVWAMLSERG